MPHPADASRTVPPGPAPARPPSGPVDPRAHYRARRAEGEERAGALELRLRRTSHLRIGAFLLWVAPLLLLETLDRDRWPVALAVAAIGLGLFALLVFRHRSLRRDRDEAVLTARIAAEGLARLDRRWDELPPPPLVDAPRDHPSAQDLDLVGHASLAHLLGRVHTGPGREELRRLLLDPPDPLPTLRTRQDAVLALAPHATFREDFERLARTWEGEERPGGAAAFFEWATAPGLGPELRHHLRLARFLALFTPLATTGWLLGWGVPGLVPLAGAVAAFVLQRRTGSAIHARLGAAEAGEGSVRRWSLLLRRMEELPGDAERLVSLREAVREPAPGAARALRSLLRILDWGSVRYSAFAHYPLVALLAWDLHILWWLERWQRRHGPAVGAWIRALGEMEALVTLAGLAHDHPDWCRATFDADEGEGIRADALGHPLLPPERCVRNAVELPGPGRLLLVTGSNMAGKTTLLRALGTNQVLALAGAPVSAGSFRTRLLVPWTTMAVRDSLTEGVSLFLAELRRLRRVVDAAESGPVLYLLDEILQGTNSAERRTAARIVLERLLGSGAVGAVTTHDLTLADTPLLRSRSVDVHFREEVREVEGRRTLTFDYRLRPGPATSRNALLLLELVGLGPSDGRSDPAGTPHDPSGG